MPEISHRHVETNGIRMHVAEAGEGPLVLLLHGFPEGWYSWRHQLHALAEAGFRAVAPDQQGYGRTDAPEQIAAYSMFHLVGDIIGLLDALGEERATVVGHDWGAPVAWSTALWRPDRVAGVVGLSVPFRPRGSRAPLAAFRQLLGDRFYQVYFQEPGVAERELESDVRRTMLRLLYGLSGDAPRIASMMVAEEGLLASLDEPPNELPAWLTEADVEHYWAEFESTGFRGGLNWYRNIERNWELSAPWQGARVTSPALLMVGDRDVVYSFPRGQESVEGQKSTVPNLTRSIVLEGCGHWIQQERPQEVNRALLEFLRLL